MSYETIFKHEGIFLRRAAGVCDTWEELHSVFLLQYPHRDKKVTSGIIYSYCTRHGIELGNPEAPAPARRRGGRGPDPDTDTWLAWLEDNAPNYPGWKWLTDAFNEHFGLKKLDSTIHRMCNAAGLELTFGKGFVSRTRVEPEERQVEPKPQGRPRGLTLCEFCIHSVPNHGPERALRPGEKPRGCNWSINLLPVPGWTIQQNGPERHRVVTCPPFVDDGSWERC